MDESSSDLTGVDSDEAAKQDQTPPVDLNGRQPEPKADVNEEIPAAITQESDRAPDKKQPDAAAEVATAGGQEEDAVSSPEGSEPAEQEPGESDRRSETKSNADEAESPENKEEEPDTDGSVMDLDENEVETPAESPVPSSRRRESKFFEFSYLFGN